MKVNRHGQATVLTTEHLDQLLDAAPSPRYRALWSLQRWSAARITETLSLTWGDVAAGHVTYRKATTKTKATKQIRCTDRLQAALDDYRQAWADEHGHAPTAGEVLFPATASTHTGTATNGDRATAITTPASLNCDVAAMLLAAAAGYHFETPSRRCGGACNDGNRAGRL